MPYISQDRRNLYDKEVGAILRTLEHITVQEAAGDFTYVVYRLLQRFSLKFWMRALGIGCLICAILEIYRKSHVDYEDKKIAEHGDIQHEPMY